MMRHMRRVLATCPDCGDCKTTTADVTVRLCTDTREATLTFRCPQCTMAVTRPASKSAFDSLTASGCRLEEWRLPAELFEPRLGPPISHDDLIDFHAALKTL